MLSLFIVPSIWITFFFLCFTCGPGNLSNMPGPSIWYKPMLLLFKILLNLCKKINRQKKLCSIVTTHNYIKVWVSRFLFPGLVIMKEWIFIECLIMALSLSDISTIALASWMASLNKLM